PDRPWTEPSPAQSWQIQRCPPTRCPCGAPPRWWPPCRCPRLPPGEPPGSPAADSRGIQQSGPPDREGSGIRSGGKHLGQNVPQLPGVSLLCCQGVKGVHHGLVVVTRPAVNGEHAAGLPHSQHLLAGEL